MVNKNRKWICFHQCIYDRQEKFGKAYAAPEDRFRRGIFFANKDKIAKYDELLRFGLTSEKLELNIFADYTRDELFLLRSGLEIITAQDEWDSYKVQRFIMQCNDFNCWVKLFNLDFQLTYGKIYDDFEDRFRKTVYFIVKDTIEAHNKMFERGLVGFRLLINEFTDYYRDELPHGSYALPPTVVVPAPLSGVPVVHSRIAYPSAFVSGSSEHYGIFNARGLIPEWHPASVIV